MWVYLNNQFVEDDQACVSVFDRGFLYGDGIFETLRVYETHLLCLHRHIRRLRQSCEVLGLRLPTPEPPWKTLLCELVQRNHLEHSMIRITISRGVGSLGLEPTDGTDPTVVLCPRPLPQLTKEQWKQGVTLTIVNTRRQPSSALPSHIKSLNYLNNILAKQEAVTAQTFDGLFLNTDGSLCECTTSNIFFIKDQHLYTPSLECGILPGITRNIVLELARARDRVVHEGIYRPEDLMNADECFLTNTAFGILPVSRIETTLLASGRERLMTNMIRQMYERYITNSICVSQE